MSDINGSSKNLKERSSKKKKKKIQNTQSAAKNKLASIMMEAHQKKKGGGVKKVTCLLTIYDWLVQIRDKIESLLEELSIYEEEPEIPDDDVLKRLRDGDKKGERFLKIVSLKSVSTQFVKKNT